MAVNPMQRKANNSFLLGMLITLLITGLIIAFLILQVSKLNKEKQERDGQKMYAYVVTSEIKSGSEIKSEHVKGGVEVIIATSNETVYDSRIKGAGGVYQQESDGTYSIKPFQSGLKAKVDLHPGTILTSDITYQGEELAADVRIQEYNVITLPSQLENDEYIDIRLRLPNGQDYIVVPHKQVTIPEIAGVGSGNCIWVNMSELETLTMSGAIIEAYKAEGAKLYATRYVEAALQHEKQPTVETYVPSDEILALVKSDSNVVQEAVAGLISRMEKTTVINGQNITQREVVRQPINSAIDNENAEDNMLDGVQSEIKGLQEEREKYLESLGGY